MYSSVTSTTLLDGLREPGNEPAWRRFYDRYRPLLLAYAKRVGLSDADAQDALGETMAVFVSAYRAGDYDRSKGRLKSWLGGIIRHKALHIQQRRRPVPLDAAAEDAASGNGRPPREPAAPNDLDAAFEKEWRLHLLHAALERLRAESDPDVYQTFDLYAVKGWPAGQVAEFVKVNRNVVFIRKTRTLQRLREVIADIEREEDA